MRTPSGWQYLFGPAAAPVRVAGASAAIRRLVEAIAVLGTSDGPKCVVVEGRDGCGKSLAAAAFHAICQERAADAVFVNEGTESDVAMRRMRDAEALIVDNLDRLPAGVRSDLFERRHGLPCGALLTVSMLSPLERQLLGDNDDHHPIGQWEDRPGDVLIIASESWDEVGHTPGLADLCGDGAVEVLVRGPWSRGAHSIRRAVVLLGQALELDGYFERAPRQIETAEVLEALVSTIREEHPPETVGTIRIVVEGSTDAEYLRTAAQLAEARWNFDLLAGFSIAPPGMGRDGGAQKAVRELLRLEAQGVPAVALFDDDEEGRSAAKDARRFSGQKVLVLPAEFDPLKNPNGRGRTEIEDLICRTLLERFYEEHPDIQPEERTVRGDLVRVVVAGPDKDTAAAWIRTEAMFEDLEKMVYVICLMRESLGLPLPVESSPLSDWLRALS